MYVRTSRKGEKSVSKFISKEMGRNLVKITFVTSRYSTYLKQSHGRNLISGGFLRRLNACEHLRLLFGTRHGVKVNLAARFLPRGGREREKESSLERSLRIFLRRVVLKIGNHRSCSPWAAVTPPISPAVADSINVTSSRHELCTPSFLSMDKLHDPD